MKVLVFGSIPPPAVGHRQSLLHEVLRRKSEGDDVEVVALDHLAAAHSYLSTPGLPAVVEVGLLARRAEAVVLQLEPGLPVRHSASRAERTAALVGLSAALRVPGEVVLRLAHRDDLPGGPGGRAGVQLWKVATRIEVGDVGLRDELAAVVGPLADRIVVIETPSGGGGTVGRAGQLASSMPAEQSGWGEGAEATADHVVALVRRRAAASRRSLGERGRLPVPGGGTGTRVDQWQWLPTPGAGVPDLGPVRYASPSQGGRRRGARRETSVRSAARRLLAAAERRPMTRPAAHLARTALSEVRAARAR